MAGALRFSTMMRIRGINPFVLVSATRAKKLQAGWRKPMPVCVRINGKPETPWRINMMPAGDGSFYLYLHGDVRKASSTKVGDRVEVELRFDPAYRGGPMAMPDRLAAALAEDPKAKTGWNALIPSRQKEILRYLGALKSPAARARNIARVMHVLSGRPARFMARDWKGGR